MLKNRLITLYWGIFSFKKVIKLSTFLIKSFRTIGTINSVVIGFIIMRLLVVK